MKPPPASPGPPRSSDPKPREGTETSSTIIAIPSPHVSSDPKPREGTETWDICCPPGEMLSEVVRPKTPRGDGNLRQPFRCDADGRLGSSDPKPREGTETGQRSTPALVDFRVVRPKTPRGDGNRMDPGELQMVREVVRPKTPRGDGNPATIAPARADDSGRQTQNPERGRKLDCANWLGADPGGRQTQNPERGRKLVDDRVDVDVPIVESSDPKPREGTETWSVSPQTARLRQVVRPKTPRGDGNPTSPPAG
ncbi:Uncharacterised protein [Mycobacterium tuberculosis]|nr:Uncharacterised protein [Mycobacterium tuberculosis]